MTTLLESLQLAAIFLAGLVARLVVLVLVVAAVAVPIVLAFELWLFASRLRERRTSLVQGIPLDGALHYSPTHAWLSRRLRSLRVGVDGLAARILHGAESVDLPSPGTRIEEGGLLALVKVAGRQAGILAPCSGTVVAVNRALARDPGLLERSPYHRGWLVALRPAGEGWRSLKTGDEARGWLASEEHRLGHLLESELGLLAADGGDLVIPPAASLSNASWHRVVDGILGTCGEPNGPSAPTGPAA